MSKKARSFKQAFFFAVSATIVLLFVGIAFSADPVLKMATTTSTDNTGLLDYLAPIFKTDAGVELQWVSVGTGKALEYGRNGDVDVVLTHDPESEKAFIDGEFGVEPKQVMYNDFVVIGP
ncbi:MAG: substrate-binding domain-containing protein, partial [Synergistaceae bacterium]|nr:substrate-binding domain-containing protein [Synergistaceae bacterium]